MWYGSPYALCVARVHASRWIPQLATIPLLRIPRPCTLPRSHPSPRSSSSPYILLTICYEQVHKYVFIGLFVIVNLWTIFVSLIRFCSPLARY